MRHVERRHSITLAGRVEVVFPLFSPHGETRWADGWNPEYLFPESGATCEGMVFRTGEGSDVTLWTCVEWDTNRCKARYVRVTPASRLALVTVECQPTNDGRTIATVEYAITALGPGGEAFIDALTPEAFSTTIDGWQKDIDRLLEAPA